MKIKKVALVILISVILTSCHNNEQNITFYNLNEAESELGELDIPKTLKGNDFETLKITYHSNNFTHPTTKILFRKGNQTITFMLSSSLYDSKPSVSIKDSSISDMTWIKIENYYVLKWRNSKYESYKYLMTNNKFNKEHLIDIAES